MAHWLEIASLAAVIVASMIVQVAPLLTQRWFGGDLLYHSGLVAAILRGEFLPGGPYEGLPSYYPPGFHVAIAAIMVVLGTTFDVAIRLLTIAWLPVLPIGTYLLTRRLTGRHWVALLATVLTIFGGGLDLGADRTWVNSLFISGQVAAPVYPRDIVFSLLPWAMLLALNALEATGRPGVAAFGWAAGAGLILGASGLVQVQLLLPIPIAIVAVAAARYARRRSDGLRLAAVVGVIGVTAFVPVLPWILAVVGELSRGGGLSLDSSEFLVPLRVGFWDLPRQFGLLLPFAAVGAGVVLLFLRGRGPQPIGQEETLWHPSAPESPLLLVVWAAVPFSLAFLYNPTWPLEDALRPQRLFLLASQPLVILAAMGVVTVAEDLRPKLRRPRALAAAVAIVLIVATVPVTLANGYRAATAFEAPMYAHLDLTEDRVPDFRTIAPPGGRFGLLTYEDWSALAWYETGAWVVGMDPPGYSKLAFDPEIFTGVSQADRRAALLDAFDGRLASIVGAADRFGASMIVLAKLNGWWGTIDQSASMIPSVDPGAVRGEWSVFPGNGWDALELEFNSSLTLPEIPAGDVHLAMRMQSARERGKSRVRVVAVGPDGTERTLLDQPVDRAGRLENWPVIEWSGTLLPGERVRIDALASLFVQSIRGYVPAPAIPDGWTVQSDGQDNVVLVRDRDSS
ncbi:MAG TPA: hypothetical protein VFV72_16815 [Candidatus Limnocylindrales bacterium]|nr:hypothetical protein [Candidatus Limnocylindrales bacterium]